MDSKIVDVTQAHVDIQTHRHIWEPFSGTSTAHGTIGPFWLWIGRYRPAKEDDDFWNVYTNNQGHQLAIRMSKQADGRFVEVEWLRYLIRP